MFADSLLDGPERSDSEFRGVIVSLMLWLGEAADRES
jgi:hypothetical protein